MDFLTVAKTVGGYLLEDGTEIVCPDNSVDYSIAMVDDDKIVLSTALLHLHTGYSLLDGAIKAGDLAKLATKNLGEAVSTKDGRPVFLAEYPQVCAITDHGNIFGAYEFDSKLKGVGMKPIIGCEVYSETIGGEKKGNHLILLCKDETGYHNLCKILSLAEENFYNKPHVKWSVLQEYHEGLVCLSACLAGEIPSLLLKGDPDEAFSVAENLVDIFGDDFYIEIQNHHITDEDKIRPQLIRLAKELGVKTVCTTDSHYLLESSKNAHEILLCVQTGSTLSDPNHFRFDGDGYYVPTNADFCNRFSFLKESIANQAEIVKKCNFNFKKKEITMPVFPTGDKTIEEQFVEQCWRGFHERFDNSDVDIDAYKERLEYEMSVIAQMKFQAYFLIVADFISYAKNHGIAVGPGRGSAVGSLVAYSLGITNLDPIPYGLLFERFLNPERVSWPDIDIDFQDTRRQEVIDYVKAKYGADCVSRIITFGTLAARLVVRDVARATGINLAIADKIAKAIPAEPKMTIDKALAKSLEFQELYKDPQVKQLVDVARQLEGLPRHKSQHACGVIISAKPVDEFCPEVLLEDKNGQVARTAAFTMTELEDMGLLKMDFLGLRNMGIIKSACDDIDINEDSIPLTDPYVYRDVLATANTDGIFQVESGGMKGLMRDMFFDVKNRVAELETKYGVKSYAEAMQNAKAGEDFNKLGKECFERLIAAISLYRPGPMDYIPQYIAGMKNPKAIHYDTPELKEILDKTYGVTVYQEQVQQIVRRLAGYSLGRGDLIRRAMGKKKQAVMDAEKEIFLHGNADSRKESEALVPGCVANGISEDAALTIWNKMAKFAEYAFNKSHAAGYSVISIQTAWIKKYYPTEFWAETMNSVITKTDKLKKYISSAKADGMKLLSPDINLSVEKFSIVGDGEIRMGLIGLRNVGKSSGPIVAERTQKGQFASFEDFVSRLMPDKRYYESLVYSGALDCFAGTRRAKIEAEDSIGAYKQAMKNNSAWFSIPELDEWYNSFFKIEVPNVGEMDESDKLEKEYHYAGMYVSAHPLDRYKLVIDSFNRIPITELVDDDDDDDDDDNGIKVEVEKQVTVVGVVKELEQKLTKKGDCMYVFKLEDETGDIRTTMFPREVGTYGDIVHENAVVRIDGTWKNNDFGVQIVVSNVVELSAIKAVSRSEYVLDGTSKSVAEIISVCDKYSSTSFSSIPVFIDIGERRFAISRIPNGDGKRAVKVDKNGTYNDDNFVKVSSSFEAFAALREVAELL